MKQFIIFAILLPVILFQVSCRKKEGCTDPTASNYNPDADKNDGSCVYTEVHPNYAQLNIPSLFQQLLPPPNIPSDNPLTYEGISLGRKLFFDPILSGDGTQSCASCHSPKSSFSDTSQFSLGIDGLLGGRNAPPIFNLAWSTNSLFFWDGRAISVEDQALGPVINPVEMHNTWVNAAISLQANSEYPTLFKNAFGTSTIDSLLVAKAIAQFERTLISANSRFDKFLLKQLVLTSSEMNGFDIFMDGNRGDCFHCHGGSGNPLWTDNLFHNNGLDATFTDNGLGDITGNSADNGKFKTPSLRNLVFTAPYMHDGRFATIDAVIEHYSSGVVNSPTIDPLMEFAFQGGVQLTVTEKTDLKAFLLTLTDDDFVNNPSFQAP